LPTAEKVRVPECLFKKGREVGNQVIHKLNKLMQPSLSRLARCFLTRLVFTLITANRDSELKGSFRESRDMRLDHSRRNLPHDRLVGTVS
jgi:hypothetical protein